MSLRYCKTKLTQQKSATLKECHYFTLWIKRSSCIKMYNLILTDNCKKIRPEYQLTTVQMSELKAVLEMITTCLYTSWKTSTPLTHCSNDGVIQLGPLSSDVMFEVVEITDACFVHLLLQDAPHAVVFQLVWRWVVVILSTSFNSDIRTVVSWYSGLISYSCQLWRCAFQCTTIV